MNLDKQAAVPTLFITAGVVLACMLGVVVYVYAPERQTPIVANADHGIASPINFAVLDQGANLADLERGRAYYAQLCIACHGATGRGNGEWAYRVTPLPVDLTSDRVQGRSDAFLFNAISDGLVGTPMRGLKDQLSDTQRRQIVKYLRHLGAQPIRETRAES